MKTVWKYAVEIRDEPTTLAIPKNAEIKHVDMQNETLCFWAELETDNPLEERIFAVHGTSHLIRPNETYRGTVMAPPFVWHLYEILL